MTSVVLFFYMPCISTGNKKKTIRSVSRILITVRHNMSPSGFINCYWTYTLQILCVDVQIVVYCVLSLYIYYIKHHDKGVGHSYSILYNTLYYYCIFLRSNYTVIFFVSCCSGRSAYPWNPCLNTIFISLFFLRGSLFFPPILFSLTWRARALNKEETRRSCTHRTDHAHMVYLASS